MTDVRPSTSRRRATIRSGLVAALSALVLAGSLTAAAAAPHGYDEEDQNAGRFYTSFEAGVSMFTYDVEAVCSGADEPTATARVHSRDDGGAEIKVNARDVAIYLYYTPSGAPEFQEATCQAIADGDPTVEPFAVGTAGFKERISVAPDGYQDHFNGLNGVATGADGTVWKVRSWADFAVDADGNLIGDPAEFQGLTIHRAGP